MNLYYFVMVNQHGMKRIVLLVGLMYHYQLKD